MIIGICKETFPGERRVAVVPHAVPGLTKEGLEVLVEQGAGNAAGITDAAFAGKGAKIAAERSKVFSAADIILQVRSLGANPDAGKSDLELMRSEQTIIGFSEPLSTPASAREIAVTGVTSFSMELLPRITRAQSMDALSSMATIAGYKAVLLATEALPKMFAIHPVAGRMPGHMNVLLAEADIPYDKLKEMDEINPTLETVDVALVIGANDVVNPVARSDPSSSIAGMPIIDVDKCHTVVVIKRSLSPGFAGIPNPLFAADNTLMLFNDGKKAFRELITAVKES